MTLFLVGAVGGVLAWGAFNTFMEFTNTPVFCVSCHEMERNPYAEYKTTIHYANRSGVSATCADCHVPREWTAKVLRKIHATNELFHKLAGTIATPEKFEAKRKVLAERVWASMIASDSRECRNCHSYAAMDFSKQQARARDKMEAAMQKGETCIECHRGIAHKLPPRERDD